MKILLSSDLHSNLNGIARLVGVGHGYDLIFVAGDMIDRDTSLSEACGIIDSVKKLDNLVIVHGNSESREVIKRYKKVFDKRYLDFSTFEIGDFQFVGIGGAVSKDSERHYPDWNKRLSDLIISDKLPKIVISHYPARGINDLTVRKFHAGILEINKFIARIKPVLLITGHIHEAAGVSVVEVLKGEYKARVRTRNEIKEFSLSMRRDRFIAVNAAYACLRGFVELSFSKDSKKCFIRVVS